MCPSIIFFSRSFNVKTFPQNAEVWYRSRRWNRSSRSYLCNALTEFIITIREQDDRVVEYWFLPRNTYTYCLPRLCMLSLCSNNTTDSVMLQRILWSPLELHTTDSVFLGCNQIASWWYQGWLDTNYRVVTDLVRSREGEILLTKIFFYNFDVYIREFLCSQESQNPL